MAKADSPTKTCGEDGCGRPLRARGLCATHYNQQHQPDGHRKVMVDCTWCGASCEKAADRSRGYAGRFCTFACRSAWRTVNPQAPPQPGSMVRSAAAKARAKLRRAARGTRGTTWVARLVRPLRRAVRQRATQ